MFLAVLCVVWKMGRFHFLCLYETPLTFLLDFSAFFCIEFVCFYLYLCYVEGFIF